MITIRQAAYLHALIQTRKGGRMSAAAKYWALIIQREIGTRQAAEYLAEEGVPLEEAHELLINQLRKPYE